MRCWRTVTRFWQYLVSDDGLVKRIGGKRLLKQGLDQDGYPVVCLYNGTRESQTVCKVATLVLEAFVSARPSGLESCHEDGNPANSHVTNLRWDTHASNVLDAIRHNTHVCTAGESNGRAKIELWDVVEIMNLWSSGESLADIGLQFGLHPEYVRLIVRRRYWRHVYELVI